MFNWAAILQRCEKVLRLPVTSYSKACQLPPGANLLSRPCIHSQPASLWVTRCYYVQDGNQPLASTTALRDDFLGASSPTCYRGIVGATNTDYLQDWEHNFGKIFGTRTRKVVSDAFSHGSGWAEELLRFDSAISIKSRWLENPYAIRRHRWPIMLLHCLTASARKTLLLLHSLPRESYMLIDMTMDCLLFLKRVYRLDIASDPALQGLFKQVLSEMRRIERWPTSPMRQRHLDLFLEEASPDEGRQLLNDFRATYSQQSTSTMLRFMDFFTKTGDIENALDCLQRIAPVTLAASQRRVLARCTNLLKLDTVRKKGPSYNFDILPRMLEIGIKPNLIIHNIVIKNAFRAGMSGVGWDLFHFMQEQGLTTDARTYLVLLKDAFLQQNSSRLNELFSAIHQRADLFQNAHIVAYTLNIVRLLSYQKRLSPAETVSNMLPMYTRAFNIEPLRRLGLMTDIETSVANAQLPQPDPRTLAFTVWSYILSQREPFVVNTLWHWFQRHIQAGDPLIVSMSQHDIVYNGFAVFHSRREPGLNRCLAIVQHMLDSGCCEPTARTWSILLLAFVKHGRFSVAEKVKKMMLVRGVKPDEDTRRLLQEQLLLSDMTSHAREVLRRLETDVEPPQGYQMPEADPKSDAKPDEVLEIRSGLCLSG